MNKQSIIWIVVLIIIIALGFVYFDREVDEAEELVVSTQAPGTEVVVERIELDRPGFIVIYERASDGSQVVVGTSDLLTAGVHENVVVTLSNPSSDGDRLVVIAHEDDGNGEFDGSETDLPATDKDGEIIGEEIEVSEDVEHEHEPVDDTMEEVGDGGNEGEGMELPEGDGTTITYTNEGFSPSPLTVSVGTTVTWVNNSSRDMWTASAMHPTHTVYPGSDIQKCDTATPGELFDACGAVAPGESFSFTFDEVGEWGYHDHLRASEFGRVIVE